MQRNQTDNIHQKRGKETEEEEKEEKETVKQI